MSLHQTQLRNIQRGIGCLSSWSWFRVISTLWLGYDPNCWRGSSDFLATSLNIHHHKSTTPLTVMCNLSFFLFFFLAFYKTAEIGGYSGAREADAEAWVN